MHVVIPHPSPATLQTVAPLPRQLSRQISRGGLLESKTLGVTVLGFGLLVIALWLAAGVARRKRGRRLLPRLPRWAANAGGATLSVLLVVGGGAILVNNYAGYVPNVGDLFHPPTTTEAAGASLEHGIVDGAKSRVLKIDVPDPADGIVTGTTYVYLPPGYDEPANAGRRYPTVYLLHGFPGHAADWFVAGQARRTMDLLLAHHYIGPMILVAPTASQGFLDDDECLDAPGHFRLEHYLVVHVVDTVDRTFRTLPTRDERAIGGMSSGAYCALNIGLHHLHRFSVILASEPYGDPGGGTRMRWLGGDWARFRADSPDFYLPFWNFRPPVAVFLDSGGADRRTTENALRLARLFAGRGQAVAYREAPHQRHNWTEARDELPYSLIFAWQHFGRLPNGGSDRYDAEQVARALAYARSLPTQPEGNTPSPMTTGPDFSTPPSTRPTPAPRRPATQAPTPTPSATPVLRRRIFPK